MRTASALIAAAAALALSAPAASATMTSSPAPVVLTESSEAPELTREELIEAAIKASEAYAKKQTPKTEAALREALEAWLEDVTERMDELDAKRDEAGELPQELADSEAELLEERVLLRKLYKELSLDDASTHPLPTILTEANVAEEEAEVTTAVATAAEPTLRQRVVTLEDETTTSDTTTSETTTGTATDTTTTNTTTSTTTGTSTSTTTSATTSGTATVLENRTTEATTTRSSTSSSSSTSSTTRTSTPTSTTSTTRSDDLAETGTPMLGLIALGALLVVGGVFLTRHGNK
ncbi:hypothetical protein [Corynebacterium sp. HMSC29G08]|uniref:hypothetical protein n=1 Tax=Corynebacterium sp. HMSC29G08 TaxID=1581069 RepID=UPI0008A115B6|nr:hypothetical protein [Corynebacterium sp. HMSC29G08]OFT81481.1 hypothetical protein HMPREF3101_10115 [Corynebacterium sp. HMSC29G08]